MKRTVSILLAAAAFFAFNTAWGVSKSGKKGGSDSGTMNVEVRQVIVKATPGYMGQTVGTLNYGDSVSVIGEDGNWYHIDKPSGWVPKSALTKHKLAVNPDEKFAGKKTSHDEVALAGKGFNPQVEDKYKRDNASLAAAYQDVDRVESLGVNETELKQFQAAGKLKQR